MSAESPADRLRARTTLTAALAAATIAAMMTAPPPGAPPARPASQELVAPGAFADVEQRRDDTVRYLVSLPAPQTQMLDMTIEVPARAGDTVELALPTWRPGRYEILDPSGTVREERAETMDGKALSIRRTTKNRWLVEGTGGEAVRVSYRVYANSIGNRTRHVDDTHAFLSPSSCFMYDPALRSAPIVIDVEAPEGWRIGTGLAPALDGTPGRVTARDYDELADSPLEIGEQAVLSFESRGVPHEILIWPPDAERDDQVLIDDFKAIVDATLEIFDRVPYERYVFMIHVGAGGGGTEHVNSTIMQTRRASLEGTFDRDASYRGFLGLVAHEYFHTFNVKQFRPAGIKPYDYDGENYTPLLWVAEGTTSYYDELLPARAGLVDADRLLSQLGGQIRSTRSRPGRFLQSVAQSSFDAWVKFNARTPDDANCTISFYTKGSMVSFLLDLELRRLTDGRVDLDVVLADLDAEFPLERRGFTTDDLKSILTRRTGTDWEPWFAAYIDGTETLPLEEAVAVVGLELVFEANGDPAEDGSDDFDGDGVRERPWLGLSLQSAGDFVEVRSVRSDGPAYAAGLTAGDVIVAIDGRRLGSGDLDARLERRAPGETVEITYFRRDMMRTMQVPIASQPDGRWVLQRMDDDSVTEAQQLAYRDWCGHDWPGTGEDVDEDAGVADVTG